MRHNKTLLKRFWGKVNKRNPRDCWSWTASVINGGYGRIATGNSAWALAHRVSWEIHKGTIPEGMCVLHKCDTRNCVNPSHLFLGTKADNMHDAMKKGRHSRGEIHGKAKVNNIIIKTIRSSTATNVAIAKKFGLSEGTVSSIKHRRLWKHI